MDHDGDPEGEHGGIDREHQVQMGLILALEQGLALGKPHAHLRDILDQLVAYSDIHFMSEQLLMRLYAYPDMAAHEATHDRLMEQSRRVIADFSSGELSTVSAELLELKQCLLDHIRTEDYALHRHLSEQSLQ